MRAIGAWPNEIGGLCLCDPSTGQFWWHWFGGYASPTGFAADPEEVVRLAYLTRDHGWLVAGTVHSHPLGPGRFSRRDQALAMWGRWHVLWYRQGTQWHARFARRTEVARKLESAYKVIRNSPC